MKNLTLLFLVFISACSFEKEEWIKPESVTLTCDDDKVIKLKHGLLTNNVWNKQAAQGQAYAQCLESRLVNGEAQYGWSWNWPNTQRAVFGQPQIKTGQSPWQPEDAFGDSLPLSLSKLKTLRLASNLEVSTNGEHNAAITMWFIESLPNNKEAIRLELMIWTYYTDGQFNPAGRKQGEFVGEQVEWEYWQDAEWADVSGTNSNKWQHITFRRKQPSLDANTNIKELIDYAIERGHIDPDWIIADLEFGTEVMAGQGLAWLKKFDIEIEELATTSSKPDQ